MPDKGAAAAEPPVRRNQPSAPEETTACPRCFGTGLEVVPGKGARRCLCREQDQRAKLIDAAHIPRRYDSCSLASYYPAQGNGSQLKAFNYASGWCANIGGRARVALHGYGRRRQDSPDGSDPARPHREGHQLPVSEFGSLLKEIQDSYNPVSKTSELRVLAPVYQAEVLVLDELGHRNRRIGCETR